MEESKSYFALIAIVAIVAIVGLIYLSADKGKAINVKAPREKIDVSASTAPSNVVGKPTLKPDVEVDIDSYNQVQNQLNKWTEDCKKVGRTPRSTEQGWVCS